MQQTSSARDLSKAVLFARQSVQNTGRYDLTNHHKNYASNRRVESKSPEREPHEKIPTFKRRPLAGSLKYEPNKLLAIRTQKKSNELNFTPASTAFDSNRLS